ncbi:MAG TPA: hypothetical protein VES97_01105 [Solirubrobacteraceae bacterium]|nr:hypothetical protein [Solirubrobacteraceae bacterium]
MIVAALREQLDMERQLADTTDPRERARAETNVGVIEELLAMIEASAPMATVPADAVLRIREALYAQLGKAAEDLADASWKPERGAEWAEPVARFDRNRALLDEIGCNEPGAEWAEIDLDTHWQTIVTALHWDLGTYEHLADTQDADQRERATANAAAIERLLGELEGGDDDRA